MKQNISAILLIMLYACPSFGANNQFAYATKQRFGSQYEQLLVRSRMRQAKKQQKDNLQANRVCQEQVSQVVMQLGAQKDTIIEELTKKIQDVRAFFERLEDENKKSRHINRELCKKMHMMQCQIDANEDLRANANLRGQVQASEQEIQRLQQVLTCYKDRLTDLQVACNAKDEALARLVGMNKKRSIE